MEFKRFKNKRIVIMGLGLQGGGRGDAEFFAKNGAKVLVTDLKDEKELESQITRLKKIKNIEFKLGRHDEDDFKKADLIVKNPTVPDDSKYLKIAKAAHIPIQTDLDIFLDLYDLSKIIGITGTKGKTTLTNLIYKMVESSFPEALKQGDVEESPLAILDKAKAFVPIVAEMSNLRLKGVAKSPHIAVMTNIFKDHLDKHVSMQDYISTKKNIYRHQNKNDFIVLNKDDSVLSRFADEAKSKVYFFSIEEKLNEGAYLDDDSMIISMRGEKCKICKTSDLKIKGKHNIANALAASLATRLFGVDVQNIKKTLLEFSGVASRLELVRITNGVSYYNDTTATIPEATIVAINSFEEPKILIAGGSEKNLDFENLAKEIVGKVRKLILLKDKASIRIESEVKKIKKDFPIVYKSDMHGAVMEASKFAKTGDIVLMSPAAASFGLFKNEFDRGKQFIKEAKKL